MDSSPRPQRRFSRWRTTKRTFVLAGVVYKPTDTNTVLQDDNEKSGSGKKAKKDNSDKNDKNKNSINHSTADSFTKPSHHNSPLVAKSSVARRLCLDTSRRKDSKTNTVNSNKTTPTAQDLTAVDTVFSGSSARKEDSVPRSTSSNSTEKFDNYVEVDPPLVQDFHLQLERVDLEFCEESVHQNKYALSNISQNKSADTPSQIAPEDKSSTVHTLPSQKKVSIAVNNVTEGFLDDDVIANEANKRKRQAADDDKSSDSSSTDKENVEKDSTNISVPSQSKKMKKDAAPQIMPSTTRNMTSKDVNVLQKNNNDTSQAVASSARRSGLRNRSLLVSPETLLKNRQYPVFQVAEKKTVSDKNVSEVNSVSFVEMGSSVNRKTAKKTLLNELEPLKGKNSSREILNEMPLPVLELTKDLSFVNSGSTFSRRSKIKKGSSELEVSVANDTSSVNTGSLNKRDQSKTISRIKAVQKNNSVYQKKQNKDSSVNSSRNDLTTPSDGASVHTVHSEDGSKRGLRDRRLLPTPEEVQRQRLYPVEFLLPKRRSFEKSESDGHQKSVQNRDSFSQIEQAEPSPAATKEIIKGQALKNKHKSKKCSPSLQHTSFNSQETSEPKRRSSGKSDNNSHQKSVQNRDSLSQLGQTQLSPAATKDTIKGKSLQNTNLAHKSSKSQHKSTKRLSSLQHTSLSSEEISEQPTAPRGSHSNVSIEKQVGAEDVGLSAKAKIATSFAEKESINLSVHSVQSEDTGSFSARSRLRDRSLLPTPVEVQQHRLYPVEFLLPKRRSSEKSESDTKQKGVQNRDSFSQVEQTEPSPAATKEIMKEKSLKNKNTAHESSKSQHRSKKCSPSLQHTSLSSQEISQPKRRSSERSDKSSQQKSFHNRDSFSQPEQTELSASSTNDTIKGKSLQNKNTVRASSKDQLKSKKCPPHKSKKCAPSLQHTSLSSLEISEQSAPQRGSLCNTSIVRPIGAEDVGLRAKTKIAPSCVEKEDSSLLVQNAHSEDTNSVSAKNRLGDQSLLPTAGEGQHHRQYPTKFLLSSRSSVKKSPSDSRHDVSVEKQQKEVQNKEVSLQLEQTEMSSVSAKNISRGKSLSNKKETNVASSKSQPRTKKCSLSLHSSLSSHKSPTQPVQQREAAIMLESLHHASVGKSVGTENIKLTTKSRIETSHVERKTGSMSIPDVQHKDADSFSSKRCLRDRTKLPTAEQIQQHRQYPIEFFLNSRRSFGTSDAESKNSASGTTQQKKVVPNREPFSKLEHMEHSSAPPEIITEKSLKSNKKERHPDSQRQPERSKCSSPLRFTSLGSSGTFEQSSPQRESTDNVLTEKPVSVEAIGDSVEGRFYMECVEKTNSKHTTLKITKKNGIRIADHATMVQSTLNFSKTVSTADGAPLLDQRQQPARKTQKVSEKDSVEGGYKNNRTSILNKKPLSKTDKKQYSLPRRPVKKSLKDSHFEQSGTLVAEADISLEPSQQSITIVDTTWRRPQKLALKKHPVQQKTNSNMNDRQSVGQKHADVTRPEVSVNETLVVPKKVPRKRKLLDEADGSSTQKINEVESHVIERLQDGRTRKSSSLSAVDVILQAVRDTEDKLLAETEDDALGHRLVRKVLGRLRKKMKPLISDVEEVNNLKHEIREKNSRIRKLSAEFKEQQQLKSQLYKEIHNGVGHDQNLELMNVSETMKGYAQLMQAFANKSR